jgi:hypothetical protein
MVGKSMNGVGKLKVLVKQAELENLANRFGLEQSPYKVKRSYYTQSRV